MAADRWKGLLIMREYVVQYATPKLIARDGIEWITHSIVSAPTWQAALQGARRDAQKLRNWHSSVRIQRDGRTVR